MHVNVEERQVELEIRIIAMENLLLGEGSPFSEEAYKACLEDAMALVYDCCPDVFLKAGDVVKLKKATGSNRFL